MDDREQFEETADQYRSGASSPGKTEPYASERPAVLRPDVVSGGDRGEPQNPLDMFGKGLPDVMQRAKGFYAKHPTLVKTLGTVAVAAIARRLFRGRPGLF